MRTVTSATLAIFVLIETGTRTGSCALSTARLMWGPFLDKMGRGVAGGSHLWRWLGYDCGLRPGRGPGRSRAFRCASCPPVAANPDGSLPLNYY